MHREQELRFFLFKVNDCSAYRLWVVLKQMETTHDTIDVLARDLFSVLGDIANSGMRTTSYYNRTFVGFYGYCCVVRHGILLICSFFELGLSGNLAQVKD